MKPFLLILLFFFFFTYSAAQTTITPGTTLSASNPNQTWASPKNTFYLGFSHVGPNSYTLGINYIGGVPIWIAGNSNSSPTITTTVDSNGSFQFLSNGNLRLLDGSGTTVWESNTTSRGVTTASLDDFGKLVLKNRNLSVWSSFENPTDTIVPNQTFNVDQVLRSGYYSFRFLRTGNFILRWNDYIDYWKSSVDANLTNLTSPTLVLQQIGILTIYDTALPSGYYIVAYGSDYVEGGDTRLRFLRLDKDGNFRMYSTDRGSGTTTMVWAALTDQCVVLGYCGPLQTNPSPNFLVKKKDSQNLGKGKNWRLRVICLVVVITLLGFIALEGGLWWCCCRNSPKFGSLSEQYALLEYASGAPVQFSYKELQRSAKGFKEKLRAGGFGAVYKGVLANKTVVAVKQLEGIEQGEKQFRMEVATVKLQVLMIQTIN